MRRIFDGHLDLSWNALSWDRDITLELDVLNRLEQGLDDHPARGRATTTLPEMQRGGVAALPGHSAGARQVRVADPRRDQPPGPRLRQPGDRLGDGARPACLLRAARSPGLAADDPHRRRARRPLEELGRRRRRPRRSATSWPWKGPTRSSTSAMPRPGGSWASAR